VDTELLIIGGGPYSLSTAALAREHGLNTTVVGRAMGFWHEHMPDGMLLRSSADWQLDAAGVDTFRAYLEDRDIRPRDVDPIPVDLFLDYATWFRKRKGVAVREDFVLELSKADGRIEAGLESGQRIRARAVVAAPGVRHFTEAPAWAAELPPELSAHTCDLVDFARLDGARVAIIGGRQSAYEWAALIAEHGAERVDIVHRHDVPLFEHVSWTFIEPHVERTMTVPGYWRRLPQPERDEISRLFWEKGRLTLEYWLTPRLSAGRVHRWPGAEVLAAQSTRPGVLELALSNAVELEVDYVVIACGYGIDLARVPYLSGVLDDIETADGFPVLDESFQTTLDGLYITGYPATRDFGPFFGFVRGAPAAATVIVGDVLAHSEYARSSAAR
jgi:cation diffusion facilitator CzcD-associated flavoprotein CzcO